MVDVTTPQTASISVDRFELDRSYRRVARGAAIIGGSPLRVFRLSSAGQRVAAAIESGAALPAGHGRLTARLVAAGAIHPRPVSSPFTAADVTIVHPVFGDLPPLAQRGSPVIVVDDASSPAVHIDPPVRLIRLDVNRGPAAARNAALDHVTTPLVAFVDADVTVTDGLHDADTWLDPLLTHFTDPSVALVAPRVASVPVTTVVGRYEASRSPLDLGDQPARIAPGTRVSYVPAAAIVCRTEAIREVGGFETSMRSGEDVDLVWRLLEAGWTARYEPRSVVHHRPRATIATVLRQRFFYGTSAAALEARHPGALPLRIDPWTAASVAAIALRLPIVAGGVIATTAVTLRRRLAKLPWTTTTSLALNGHLGAARSIATELTRSWWPVGVVGLAARRTRPVVAAAIIGRPLIRWQTGERQLDPLRYTALSIADDVAYGSGVWRGAIRRRQAAALIPRLGGYRSAPR